MWYLNNPSRVYLLSVQPLLRTECGFQYIKGHFDTTVGMKNESQSYKKILEEISCNPSEAVFLTDVPKGKKGFQ